MRRRSIVSIVILTIITCGLYSIIASYQVYSDINYAGKKNDTALVDILLPLVTCGIWSIYCYYKYSRQLAEIGGDDNTIINVILGVFGFGIISICILQNSMNQMVDREQR